VGVATVAGEEALLKAPRSVIIIDWSSIHGRFYEKIRQQNNTLPKIY